MYFLPINDDTLPLIIKLNDGFRPDYRNDDSWFLYTGDGANKVIENNEIQKWIDSLSGDMASKEIRVSRVVRV